MPQEPSVDFDMEELCRRVDGAMDPQDDRERELVARGARLFAALVLPEKSVRIGTRLGRSMCLRVTVAVYLCRLPGSDRFKSLSHIASAFGVRYNTALKAAHDVRFALGLPEMITKPHKRRRGKK